jgi:hypothetical protein
VISRARKDLKEVEDVNIKIKSIEIEMTTDREAKVVCTFFVSGYYIGSAMYDRLYFRGLAGGATKEPDKVSFTFKREDDGVWRMVYADLKY